MKLRRSLASMPQADEPLIRIKYLRFSYGPNLVLKGVDLEVPRGKVVAILGASGCGKSTLLRLIGGQLKPRGGFVEVEGRVVRDMRNDELYRMRRKMGMMFQRSGLFTDLSTFENIAFPMRERTALPEPVIRDLVMMKLHAVGLRGAHNLMPNELSGGMQRRVALARAIALDPMLVMYDEPFAGLDPISLNVIANLIRRLNDALGVTTIVVSYDVVESLKIADYVYFIADGVVAAQGTVAEVKATRDPFVRQFVDCLPDGPVPFHYPARPFAADLRLNA
ncbi:MAG TPA: ABC transporter ATP-binding protein [Burkholderiales bacterium]|nr:ABC transporter ATP-binding protein [Burkholderiales bacterium]